MKVDHLVIEVPEALSRLLALLRDHELPTIDVDAALSQIVDVVMDLTDFDNRLANAVFWMSAGEGLFENVDPEFQPSQIKLNNAVADFGLAVKKQLLLLNVYSGTQCPFTYRSLVDDSTILLSRLGS